MGKRDAYHENLADMSRLGKPPEVPRDRARRQPKKKVKKSRKRINLFSIVMGVLGTAMVAGLGYSFYTPDEYRDLEEESFKGLPLAVELESTGSSWDILRTRIQVGEEYLIGQRNGVARSLLWEAYELIDSERKDGDSEEIEIRGFMLEKYGFRINSVISAQDDTVNFGRESFGYKRMKSLRDGLGSIFSKK